MKNSVNFCGLLCAAAIALAVLITSVGFAQSTASEKSAPESSAQTLRVSSRLVQVSVIVRHHGAPVTGLTKDDFTVWDQNRPQQIADFSEQSYEPVISSHAPAASSSNAIFSNHFDPDSGTPNSVTIILLDALNTPRQEMANARAAVADFLQDIKPNERVALYGLSTNLYVIHNFTNDVSSLLAALARSKNTNAYRPDASEIGDLASGNDNIDAFMLSAEQHAADMQSVSRAEMTANVMASIANSLVNIPGRKNLVWVSGSFPFQIGTGTSADDPRPKSAVASMGGSTPNNSNAPGPDNSVQYRTFLKEIEAASEAVNNANLAIYPVDARGMTGASNMSADVRSPLPRPGSSAARSRRPTNTSQATPPRENFDTMNELADRTGGRAFYNTNDIQHSVRQAVDDSRDSYVLDYYPSDTQWDGTFHTIKVEVKRPGVDVRFRKGYFAIQDASADPLRIEQMMQDAMSSPFQDTDLGLTVEAHAGTTSGTRQVSVQIGIDANRLHFKQSGEKWADDLQIIWLQFGADGKPVNARSQSASLSLSPEEYSQIRHGDVKIKRDVLLKSETVKLRIVVRDIATGAIGSVDIPLTKVFTSPATVPPAN